MLVQERPHRLIQNRIPLLIQMQPIHPKQFRARLAEAQGLWASRANGTSARTPQAGSKEDRPAATTGHQP